MTSNHFLLVILYFLTNFFLFVAEASANTDQELKIKFFTNQCQTGCSPEFQACYQKLSTENRIAIMNDLIGRRVLQKVKTIEGSEFYGYGSESIPVATAKTEFNKAVGSKCQAIAMAEAKATQAQVAKSSGSSSSSGKSGGGSSTGDLVDAAKQLAPLAGAIPGVKEAVDSVKDKAKKAVTDATGFRWGGDKTDKVEIGSAIKEAQVKNADAPSSNSSSAVNTPVNNNQSSNSQPTSTDPRPDFSIKNASKQEPISVQTTDSSKPADQGVIEAAKKNAELASEKIKDSSPEAGKAGKDIATENNASQTDAEAQAKMTEAQKIAAEFKKNIDSTIQQLRDQPPPVSEFSQSGCRAELTQLQTSSDKYAATKETCSTDTARATNLCSTVRSPQAQKAQIALSAGTALISKATAASESCGIMGNISTIANAGMLSAQAICSGMKIKCEMSCASGLAAAEKIINEDIDKLRTCYQNQEEIARTLHGQYVFYTNSDQPTTAAEKKDLSDRYNRYQQFIARGVEDLTAKFSSEKEQSASIPTATVECKKNEADILTMGAQAAALLSAAMDSKKCEEQLSSGSGGSGSGSLATTAQFCAQPGNSSSITCRCAADPNGAGCLGALGSGSDVSGFAGLQKGVGNVSGFASTASPKVSDADIQFDDVPSEIAAKTDNGLSPTSPFGAAAAGGGGSGSAGGGSAGSSKPGVAGVEEEKPKGFSMGFSSLAKGFGNLFGLKGNDKVGKTLSTEQKNIQLQAIKRKIASDQVRAEISTASGKSNFDKIKARYTETRSSLISTP